MTVDLHAHPVDRLELVESVRSRLVGVSGDVDLDRMIVAAFDDLTPATVTTYLPILVEREVRARIGRSPA